jgi:diguanylate cyclase (GGDEF)-like protein
LQILRSTNGLTFILERNSGIQIVKNVPIGSDSHGMTYRLGLLRAVRVGTAASLMLLLTLTAGAFFVVSNVHEDARQLKDKQFRLFNDAWEVRHLDESLTHSAAEYTLTGGAPEWRTRYDRLVEQLDAVIAHLRSEANGADTAPLDSVEKANAALVKMEMQVFEFTAQGKLDQAREILSGPYTAQKKIYQKGIDTFFENERARIDSRLTRSVAISSWLRFASLVPGIILALAVLAIGRSSLRNARISADRDQERNRVLRLQHTDQRVTTALDLAQTEPDILSATHDILTAEYHGHVELLLADSSRTHLRQAISTDPTRQLPGCGVPSPGDCPAIRRGSSMTFNDPTSYAACPHLRSREVQGCAATCVPVSLMGQTVGVLHGLTDNDASDHESADNTRLLDRLANQVGDRIGVIRTIDKSQLQASTDPLTGLLNRRSLEYRVGELIADGTSFSIAMFDLDHFKGLNDTHGHSTGDNAIRVFAKTLRDSLRNNDLICRWGGEEFVVVLPRADSSTAELLSERVREVLTLSLANGTTPFFTASAGVAQVEPGELLVGVINRADQALLRSKAAGRNRITLAETAAVRTQMPVS